MKYRKNPGEADPVTSSVTKTEGGGSSAPSNKRGRHAVWLIALLLIPLAGSLFTHGDVSSVTGAHTNIPLHAMLEAQGGIACVALALIMMFLLSPKEDAGRDATLIIAASLGFSGTLDGFHAASSPGNAFVWLRSLSTCGGGLILCALWWPRSLHVRTPVPWTALAMAVLAGIVVLAMPNHLPALIRDGAFTPLALGINLTGGIGYLSGAAALLAREKIHGRTSPLLFATVSLFGMAGLLFTTSSIWDCDWWWWHIVRYAASLILLVQMMHLARDLQRNILADRSALELAVAARTTELTAANTDMEHTLRDLEEARRIAERANRLKSEFLANMSHEIRTPMNAILGYSQLMSHDPGLPDPQRNRVATINRAGEHLLALINDILEMSKIEAGRITLNESAFDLHALLDELVELYAARARIKGLHLQLIRHESVPRYIVADEGKLRQTLLNLLSNAVKFTVSGGITVNADVESAPDGAILLRFVVTDTGPGIPPEELGRLFRPFVQSASGVRAGGTGLGLAISKNYALLMGGGITLKSEVGVGSTFTVTARAMLAAGAVAAREVKLMPLRLAPGSSPVRILIADDIAINRELLAAILAPIGFEICHAENGAEVLTIFDNWRPHAIIMDMRMPVIDGYEANHRIKASPAGRDTFILSLTASAFEADKAAVLASGADAFMRKPFRQEELLDLLGERLHLHYVYPEVPEAGQTRVPECERFPMIETVQSAMAEVPGDVRDALSKIAGEADYDALMALCEELETTHSTAAKIFRACVESFDYPGLQRLLDISSPRQ